MAVDILNSDAVNGTDDKSNESYLSAGSLQKNDINGLMHDFAKPFYNSEEPLRLVASGDNYSVAKDALERVIGSMSASNIMAFMLKNSWLSNHGERNKYLNNYNSTQTMETKMLVCDLYDFVTSTEIYNKEVAAFLQELSGGVLETIYKICRSLSVMEKFVSQEEMNIIKNAFVQFEEIYKKYNSPQIYNEVPANKSKYTLEENTIIVFEYMKDDIDRKSALKQIIKNPGTVEAKMYNRAALYDSMTNNLCVMLRAEAELEKKLETVKQLSKRQPQPNNDNFLFYSQAYQHVLYPIWDMLEKTLTIINDFKEKKTEAPYCAMHYDGRVEGCISEYNLGNTSSPLKNGTDYRWIFTNMAKELKYLAGLVARAANDHYGA